MILVSRLRHHRILLNLPLNVLLKLVPDDLHDLGYVEEVETLVKAHDLHYEHPLQIIVPVYIHEIMEGEPRQKINEKATL